MSLLLAQLLSSSALLGSGVHLHPASLVVPPLRLEARTDKRTAHVPEPVAEVPGEVELPGVGLVALDLRPFRAVAPDATVVSGGGTRAMALRDALTDRLARVVHLEGTVEGHPGSSVYFAAGTTGLAAWIDLADEGGLFVLRADDADDLGLAGGGWHFVRASGMGAPDVPTCGCGAEHAVGEGGVAGFSVVEPGARRTVDLAVNADYDYFHIFDDETELTEYTSALVGAIAAIYRRDCDATIRLSHLVIETDPADLFNDADPLYQFRDYWNTNGGDIERDLFTLFTGRRNLPYGGVAWLSAACSSYGYSVNGYLNGTFADPVVTNPGNWDINVSAHEFGHNLGTGHSHDYGIDTCASGTVTRGTIMSYCHVVSGAGSNIDLRFHRVTADRIESFISQAPCLDWDCDDDGVADAEQIATDGSLDTNGDGILDQCQDCNGNGVPDPVEIGSGALNDLDGDGRPDECETDCDGNGVADSVEIALDPSLDLDGNMQLDACQTDCDGDGVADRVEILADMSLDISRDGRIDACEDCDGDGIDDFTELAGSRSRWVASADDAFLRELDPRSGVLRRTVACGTSPATSLVFGTDRRLYASVGDTIWVIDPSAPSTPAAPFAGPGPAPIASMVVAPNGTLAVLFEGGAIGRVAADGSTSAWIPAGITPDAVDLALRSTPSGTEVLVAGSGGVIRSHAWPSGAASDFADLSPSAPDLRAIFALDDGGVLVASGAIDRILAVEEGASEGSMWSVFNDGLLVDLRDICDAGDGRGLLVTGTASSSTINGFNKANGNTERTYRVYGADAPAATAIAVAPPSATDLDGNLVPDECEAKVLVGDLDGNGVVDAADLTELLNSWGVCGGCPADLDGDGMVGATDLAAILNNWS